MTVTTMLLAVWALGATALWIRADERRRNLKTDLAQVMHDHGIDSDDLRRSAEYFDR